MPKVLLELTGETPLALRHWMSALAESFTSSGSHDVPTFRSESHRDRLSLLSCCGYVLLSMDDTGRS